MVEMPYVAGDAPRVLSSTTGTSTTIPTAVSIDKTKTINSSLGRNFNNAVLDKRNYLFHFSGNFDLLIPELTCSVRNTAVMRVAAREDVLVVNTTKNSAEKEGVHSVLLDAARKSTFCIVLKADAYSSAFFYHAISVGCIPVVISDWYVHTVYYSNILPTLYRYWLTFYK